MKKSLIFRFSEIYSLVLNTKKMCLGLFFEECGFDVVSKNHMHHPQHFVLGTWAYSSVFVYCFGWIFYYSS